VDEWRGHALSGSVGGAAEREKKRGRGGGASGRGSATRCKTALWGLALTGGRHPDCVPAGRDPDAARAGGASLFGQWRAGADVGGPRWKRERGGASGARARVGRPEKKTGWPSPDEQ
jgi:hypothetical protein